MRKIKSTIALVIILNSISFLLKAQETNNTRLSSKEKSLVTIAAFTAKGKLLKWNLCYAPILTLP
ncbi:hypothetical protein [Pedobacter gandavensis]|uniref:hypothetical protein n=1 Tax=Pedobacter gandavensis TaxID=2679963 RepID=UPI00292F9B75|nr:hypothetical protein [Pedobacter gandavensis]